jgi:hypothetical protein
VALTEDIPAQPVAQALADFAHETGLHFVCCRSRARLSARAVGWMRRAHVPASAYTTWGAALGATKDNWTAQINGSNLANVGVMRNSLRRIPVFFHDSSEFSLADHPVWSWT